MFKRYLLFLFLFQVLTVSIGTLQINNYVQTCDRLSPETNECLKEAVINGLAELCKGIPELDIPPIDPHHQDEIKFNYNANQIMLSAFLRDVNVYGLKTAKIHNVRLRADDDSFHMEVDATQPKVLVKGKYSASGVYNSLKLKAIGNFSVTMKNLTFTWKLDGKPEERDGETFMKITSFYMRPQIEKLISAATNDIQESRALTDLAVSVANQNWPPIYKELLPLAQDNWNTVGTGIANKIFLKVPYNQLFPVE